MSYEAILTENVKKEFEDFKKDQISQSPEAVFENAGKIHFYNEIYTYVTENNLNKDFGWRNVKKLASHSKIICLLFDEYLAKEHLSITNWETIQEIFESFLK